VSGRSDWIYADHAARALAGHGPGHDDLFIHFGHFDGTEPAERSDAALRVAQRTLNDRLVDLARVADGLRVADVGCGVGGTLASINAAFSDMELHGVNIDPRQIEAARARVAPRPGNRLAWHVADALALPLADASMDRVLAIECVPHFGSREGFLREAARVLVDGGVLALSDFVPTPALRDGRARGLLPDGFAAAVEAGLGPFDDFWGEAPGYDALVASIPLAILDRIDASAATLPTYRFILRGDPERVLASPAAALADRGVAALAWAQARGLLRMEYLALRREPRAGS